MIILDTNVVSESMRPRPDTGILAWLEKMRAIQLFFTAINYAEMLVGADRSPEGRRKRQLSEAIDAFLDGYFGDRVLPFDARAAAAGVATVYPWTAGAE